MPRLALLESFDDPVAPPTGPSVEWLAGEAAGHARAKAEAAADHERLSDVLVQSVADICFSRVEARHDLLRALEPLFCALCDRLLPGLAEAGMVAGLARLIEEAASQDLSGPATLFVAPAQRAAVASALAAGPPGVRIEADPALGPGQARLATVAGETALDTEAVIQAASAAVATLLDPSATAVRTTAAGARTARDG